MYCEFKDLEMEIVRWAEARQIIKHSTPMAQAIKTLEEVQELLSAINRNDEEAIDDSYGDVLVTLIIGCAVGDRSLVKALGKAWLAIKYRTGHLSADGTFIKDA